MSDWRLFKGQEKYLKDAELCKVSFPEFWETAYKDKNAFFQKIKQYAENYVETTNQGSEFLEGDNVRLFWHEHCDFCMEKILTDEPGVFYCTEDMNCWICEKCFNDFCEEFNWKVKNCK